MVSVTFTLVIEVPKSLLQQFVPYFVMPEIRTSRSCKLPFPPTVGSEYFAEGGRWYTGPIRRVLFDLDSEAYSAISDLNFQVKSEDDLRTLIRSIVHSGWDTSPIADDLLKLAE